MRHVVLRPTKLITVPVRLDQPTDQRIKRAARRLKTSAAAVIRLAIITQLAAVESGTLRLPVDLEAAP
jgi:hypothetical protein